MRFRALGFGEARIQGVGYRSGLSGLSLRLKLDGEMSKGMRGCAKVSFSYAPLNC